MKPIDAVAANVIFNVCPYISFPYSLAEHAQAIEDGYASHIESHMDYAVLLFKNVDDHVDGTGMAALWLVQGTGVFYCDGEEIALSTGDVLVFDDRLEHSYLSDVFCTGVNFSLGSIENHGHVASRINAINRRQDPETVPGKMWPTELARRPSSSPATL